MKKLLLLMLMLAVTTVQVDAQSIKNEQLKPSEINHQAITNPKCFEKHELSPTLGKAQTSFQKSSSFSTSNIVRNKNATTDINVGFRIPEATFYIGLTGEFSYYNYTLLLGPAYTDITWRNTSEAGTYSWSIPDPDGKKDENGQVISNTSSSDENPILNYPLGTYVSNPSLTVSNDAGSDSYTFGPIDSTYFFMGGGTSSIDYTGVGNYNPHGNLFYTTIKDDAEGVYALANFFEKPAHKYVLDSLYISARDLNLPNTTELTVIIHQMVAQSQGSSTVYVFGDTLATSTTTLDKLIGPVSNNILYSIPFSKFNVFDEELGYEIEQDFIEVEDAIMIELNGFYGVDGDFSAFAEFSDKDLNSKNNGYVLSKDENNNVQFHSFPNHNVTFCFNLGITYSFLLADDSVFKAPDTGGNKVFNLTSLYSPEGLWFNEDLPSWLSYETSFDNSSWEMSIKFTAEALPSGITGRSDTITLKTFGSEVSFFVTQGDGVNTAINTVDEKEVSIVVNNGQFELSYPEKANKLSIYNLAGQIIKSCNLPSSGNFTVAPSNMTQGIYLMVVTGKNNFIETHKIAY